MLKGKLDPEDGAVFKKAIEAAADALEKERAEAADKDPWEGHEQRHADALVAVAKASLAAEETACSERYQAVIHVDAASLQDGSGERCELDDGPVIASETARRIACDAAVVPIVKRDGEVLDVGRKTRKVGPRMRRALEARDRRCRFPGCEAKRFRQSHHIAHWVRDRGETKLSNLVLLCSYHHRQVHEGGFDIRVQEGALRFYRPDGSELPAVPEPGTGDSAELFDDSSRRGIDIGTRTCTTRWDGTRIDLDHCTVALLQQAGLLDWPPPGPRAAP